MKKNTLLLAAIAVTVLLSSCMSRKSSASPTLVNTAWQLVHAGSLTYDPKPGVRIISIKLSTDKRIAGFLGCNNLLGSYELSKGDHISFKVASTQMYCQGDAMKFEDAFNKALTNANKYKVEGARLFLFQEDGTLLADFKVMNN
ncbi:MAG: META domain-containing protein [Filimonas sp.]|nr:META domain-containing protein [Filimonas sp.]